MMLKKDPVIKKAFIILIASLVLIISIVILNNHLFINQLRSQGINVDKSLDYKFLLKSMAIMFLIFILNVFLFISRIREHGIMKAIGLTKKQFRKMVRFEGLMYGTISAVFSCIIAILIELGIFIYYAYIFECKGPVLLLKRFFIDWKSFLIVILINLSIGYIATIGPRRQVDKIEITDAIRIAE